MHSGVFLSSFSDELMRHLAQVVCRVPWHTHLRVDKPAQKLPINCWNSDRQKKTGRYVLLTFFEN